MLHVFGQPNSFETLRANDKGETNSYVMSICKYDDFVVCVEDGWNFPADYPFQASFRVKFENAVLEQGASGFKLYADGKCEDVVMEKLALSVEGGGNISDLGGYYNELKYFTDCIKAGEAPKLAGLADAVGSVKFVRTEMTK